MPFLTLTACTGNYRNCTAWTLLKSYILPFFLVLMDFHKIHLRLFRPITLKNDLGSNQNISIPYTRQITTVHTKSFSWQSVTLPLQTPVWVVRREKSLCVRYLSITLQISVVRFSLLCIFKKIAKISSWSNFRYISEGIPSLMCFWLLMTSVLRIWFLHIFDRLELKHKGLGVP